MTLHQQRRRQLYDCSEQETANFLTFDTREQLAREIGSLQDKLLLSCEATTESELKLEGSGELGKEKKKSISEP